MPPSLPNGESKTHSPRLVLGPTRLCQLIRCAVCLSDTPRRRTRRTSGVYDSDRVSNGEPASCFLFLSPPLYVSNCCVPSAEDSGNSSEDSETEEPPNKKLSPWRVRNETPLLQKEDVVNEEEETNVIMHNMATDETASHLCAAPLSPEGSEETDDKFLHQLEKEEPGEEPPEEASVSLIHQDEGQVVPAGQEVVPTSSSVGSSPLPPLLEDNERSAVSIHRVKARRGGRESPPRIPTCTATTTSSEYTDSPPHSSSKRPDEPLVVLHCLPTQHLPADEATGDSDTDSATEEEAPEEGTEDSSSTLNLKTTESLHLAEKRLCPERGQEGSPPNKTPLTPAKAVIGTSPKPLSSLLLRDLEPSSEEVTKAEEPLHLPEDPQGQDIPPGSVEPQVNDFPNAEPPAVELEPQIGPEALVCYEVDLDDPEDKEKPTSAPEHLLLMMEEQAPLPLPTLLPQHQVRSFPAATAPCTAPCLKELHPQGKAPEERSSVSEERERDSGTTLSSSVHDSRGEMSSLLVSHSHVSLGLLFPPDQSINIVCRAQVRRGYLTVTQVQAQRNQNAPRNE